MAFFFFLCVLGFQKTSKIQPFVFLAHRLAVFVAVCADIMWTEATRASAEEDQTKLWHKFSR